MSQWGANAAKNYRAGRMSIAGRGSVFAPTAPQFTQTQAQTQADMVVEEMETEEMEEVDLGGSSTSAIENPNITTTAQGNMPPGVIAHDDDGDSEDSEDEGSVGVQNSDDDDDDADIHLPIIMTEDDQKRHEQQQQQQQIQLSNDGINRETQPSVSANESSTRQSGGVVGGGDAGGHKAYAQSLRASIAGGLALPDVALPKPTAQIPGLTPAPLPQRSQQNIIDNLLEWQKLPWQFENSTVQVRCDYYRAMSSYKYHLEPHLRQQFQQHHMPEYFSAQPLLPTQTKRMMSILLPPAEANQLPPSRPHSTKMVINSTDTTDHVITQAVNSLYRHKINEINPAEYVFKVVGHHSYIEYGQMIFNYHCVRKSIRDNLDLEVVLIKRPEPLIPSSRRLEEECAYQKDYATKIKPAVYNDILQKHNNAYNSHPINAYLRVRQEKIVQRHGLKDCFNSPLFPYQNNINPTVVPQKYIDITQLTTPFNLSIMGLDNLSLEALPRYGSNIVGVYVRCMVFHGYSEYPLEAPTTTVIPSSGTLLFNEPIIGTSATLFSNLPRETRVAFLIYGKTAKENDPSNQLEDKKGPTTNTNTTQTGPSVDLQMITQGGVSMSSISALQPDYANDVQLAYVVTQMVNDRGELRCGTEQFNLWALPALDGDDKHNKQVGSKRHLDPLFIFRTQNVDNHQVDVVQEEGTDNWYKKPQQYATIRVKWPQFNQAVYSFFPTTLDLQFHEASHKKVLSKMTPSLDKAQSQQLLHILNADYLSKMTLEQKALLWNARHYLIDTPTILPKLLQCVDWSDNAMRNEMYRLLVHFTPPTEPQLVIIMLDACYADTFVREWAVRVLSHLSDEELKLYLLQLVQCLKYEPYHHSALSRFLINRAVTSPLTIGLTLFWYLKSEMIQANVAERFTMILEELLVFIGVYMNYILYKQASMIYKLQFVAEHVWYLKRQLHLPNEEVYAKFHKLLHEFNHTYFGTTADPAELIALPTDVPINDDQPFSSYVDVPSSSTLMNDNNNNNTVVDDANNIANSMSIPSNNTAGSISALTGTTTATVPSSLLISDKPIPHSPTSTNNNPISPSLCAPPPNESTLLSSTNTVPPNIVDSTATSFTPVTSSMATQNNPSIALSATGSTTTTTMSNTDGILDDDDDIPYFIVPYLSSLRVKGLVVEKCKYMSSKMVPLWLVFQNMDDGCPPTYLIFKSGDDLRQDLLTLQLLTIFDRVWLSHGLDLCMNPYQVIPTGVNKQGEGVGMIEVVLQSRTVSDIQVTYGGGARGALRLDTIDLFLREHNTNGAAYANAVQTFTRSVAGYCVATFILGIGDRHISNLMVTKGGNFLHIDFGHFLGNFKTKFGMKRERTAFVFNRDMAYVIAGSNKDFKKTKQFQNFKALFTYAFKILRKKISLFEQLFLLVIPGGLPELNVDGDLNYLRDKLYIDCDSKTADRQLHEELDRALGSFTRIVDGFIHNRVHQ